MNRLTPIAKTTAVLIAAAAALSLAACSRDDGRTAGQKLDSAVAKTEAAADKAAAEVKQESAEAKVAVDNAANKVAESTSDAMITASVNAELAKDPDLSALKIDVDTRNGKVLLQGTAPSSAAKQRATTLASNVKGVSSVENRLTVRG